MTVRVTPKMRKRIDDMKTRRDLVTDELYKDTCKKDFIYESPDGGKTIYRSDADHRSSYDDVSGVTLGDEFDSYHDTIIILKTRISQLEATIREIREIVKE